MRGEEERGSDSDLKISMCPQWKLFLNIILHQVWKFEKSIRVYGSVYSMLDDIASR